MFSLPGNSASRMRTLTACAVFVLAGGACQWGTRPKNLQVANSATGAQVALRVTSEPRDRVGELMGVNGEGLYLRERRLTFISWTRLGALDVEQFGDEYDLVRGRPADAARQQRLSLISRFRVLSPDLLTRVLGEIGQDTLDVVR